MDRSATDASALLHRAWLRWKHPRVLKALDTAERFQWLSPDEIRHKQWLILKEVLQQAYDKIPFYAEWFRSIGARPQDITDVPSFQRLPVLRKSVIRARLAEMRDPSITDAYLNHSGGSTGQPLSFYQDSCYKTWNDAFTMRSDRWAGWDFGRRTAILWGAERDLELLQRSFRDRLLTNFIKHETYLNAFRLDEDRLTAFAREIDRVKPSILRGYVSALMSLAEAIKQGVVSWTTHLHSVIAAAETLNEPQRQFLQSVFGCPVFNRYGSRDAGLIASECEAHLGLHIACDNVFVELTSLGEGGAKEVIVTTLRNRAMPLIRYAIEDVAVVGPDDRCTCGRGFPRLKEVQGRVNDMIVLSGGKLVHGEYFTHLFYGLAGVRQFQVIQETLDRLVIRVATEEGYDHSIEGRLTDDIRAFLKTDVNITFEHVADIPPTGSGKHRFTISRINRTGHEA